MWIVEFLSALQFVDVFLIGSALIFFSSLAVYAGLASKDLITYSCFAIIFIVVATLHDDAKYQWLLYRSNQ